MGFCKQALSDAQRELFKRERRYSFISKRTDIER